MSEETDKYSKEFGESTDAQNPAQMLQVTMNCMKQMVESTAAIKILLEGTEENLGVLEMIGAINEKLEATDAALLSIMEEEKRFTAAEFLRKYRDIRAEQEEPESGQEG